MNPTATAFPDREPGFNLVLAGQWTDPADDEADRLDASYGPSLDRLREVKRRWDPDNLFHLNQKIPPS